MNELPNIRPIVYTRPFAPNDDFRFFARPKELANDYSFGFRIRNVMATDGWRGGIREKRWHILKCASGIIVGCAINLDRKDSVHNAYLRGYYGFIMPLEDVCLPNEELFLALDEVIGIGRFYENNLQAIDYGILTDGTRAEFQAFQNKQSYYFPDDGSCRDFNTDINKINYLSIDESVDTLLKEAIRFVKKTKEEHFELVVGLNKKRHAREAKVLNCVCYEQPIAVLESINVPEEIKTPVSHSCDNSGVSDIDKFSAREHVDRMVVNSDSRAGAGWFHRFGEKVGMVKKTCQKVAEMCGGDNKKKSSLEPSIKSDKGTAHHDMGKEGSLSGSYRRKSDMQILLGGYRILEPEEKFSPVTEDVSSPFAQSEVSGRSTVVVNGAISDKNLDCREKARNIIVRLIKLQIKLRQCSLRDKSELLPLCDEMADVLRENGAEEIVNDEVFDPKRHINVENSSCDRAGTKILSTIRSGWIYEGEVLEKALVMLVHTDSIKSDIDVVDI